MEHRWASLVAPLHGMVGEPPLPPEPPVPPPAAVVLVAPPAPSVGSYLSQS
jgi:hypothetical protein